MGRLDNAMRRAAEEQTRKTSSATLDAPESPAVDLPNEETVAARTNGARTDLAVSPARPAGPAPLEPSDGGAPSVTLPSVEVRDSSLLKHIDSRLATKTVIDDAMLPASREQYRKLAAALHQAQRANGYKVMMVASAVAGEGKSLTATNLALTLAESYRRNVLLIDGDLRRPSLHTVFQVDGAPGLSEGLVSREETSLPLHRLGQRLTLLPAGRPTSDPIGALTSDRMRRLVEEAREVFDWVIIDTPPVGLLTDAALMSSMADGVVLVVKAESTSYEMVNRAVEAIGRQNLMGVVLNRATEHVHRASYDYYKYYGGGGTATLAVRD
jgi:protein-tyrosine kinase